jgi:hypothetical protein
MMVNLRSFASLVMVVATSWNASRPRLPLIIYDFELAFAASRGLGFGIHLLPMGQDLYALEAGNLRALSKYWPGPASPGGMFITLLIMVCEDGDPDQNL